MKNEIPNYKILNNEPNFRDTQLVYTKNNIVSIDKELLDKLSEVFARLRNSSKEKFNSEELKEASTLVKKESLARARVLKKEENKGYIAVGTLTVIASVIITGIIFSVIKSFILR